MILRSLVLITIASAAALAQTSAVQGVFIAQAAEIARRVTDADQARTEMQQKLGISPAGVAVTFAVGKEYSDAAERIEQTYRGSVSARRIQRAAGTKLTLLGDDALFENAIRQLNALTSQKLMDLKNRLTAEDYATLLDYMRAHPDLSFLPYRATTSATMPSLLQSPVQVWMTLVRGPLSRPDADILFVQNYVGAELPLQGYFMGTVVAVEPGRVLLSMEESGQADAALLFDGKDWKLNKEPAVGAVVRFSGPVIDWKKDPFLAIFAPHWLGGIDATTPFDRNAAPYPNRSRE